MKLIIVAVVMIAAQLAYLACSTAWVSQHRYKLVAECKYGVFVDPAVALGILAEAKFGLRQPVRANGVLGVVVSVTSTRMGFVYGVRTHWGVRSYPEYTVQEAGYGK